MNVTITLPDELETLLAEKAAVEGVSLEQFAIDALRRVAEMPTISDLFADVRADIQARGITDEELEQDIDAAVAEVRARRRS